MQALIKTVSVNCLVGDFFLFCSATCKSRVEPVLSGNSKTDKTKILMTNASVMNVESIAECSLFFKNKWFC